MPLMGWDVFCDAHRRPFIIVVTWEATGRQSPFEILQRLLRSVKLAGDHALYRAEKIIRIAFERETDALLVARSLDAHKVEELFEEDWAGHWAVLFDMPAIEAIKSKVEPLKRSPSSTRRPKRTVVW